MEIVRGTDAIELNATIQVLSSGADGLLFISDHPIDPEFPIKFFWLNDLLDAGPNSMYKAVYDDAGHRALTHPMLLPVCPAHRN